ncbi:hypothetical protein B0H13DRAFT_2093717 [Mycena leptocephala]|nr:hypothetical protein B0H13DRAFT_2093717 [Mycena leptocephala]
MAEAAAFATAAGAFNVASFVFGSAPDAINRLNQALSTDNEYNEARKNGEFVLKTLEDWSERLSEADLTLLEASYVRHRFELSNYQQLHLDKAQIKRWRVIDKLMKEKKIRQAVVQLLAQSIVAKESAQSATEKARFKRVKSSGSSTSDSTIPGPSTYPPSTTDSDPTLGMTNSMISLLFHPPKVGDLNVHDRLAAHRLSKVAGASDSAAGNARGGRTDTAITVIGEASRAKA